MIAVDASAIVSIIKEETDSAQIGDVLAENEAIMGAPSLLETKMVLSKMLEDTELDLLVTSLVAEGGLRILEFTPAMADVAVAAFRRFGNGRGHPAKLNFGDCMSYAVAKVHGVPLLYRGSNFAQTDIVSALS
jgi:ribonuclease VapC